MAVTITLPSIDEVPTMLRTKKKGLAIASIAEVRGAVDEASWRQGAYDEATKAR